METITNLNEITRKLITIQEGINSIREHLDDVTLSSDDLESLRKSEEDFQKGETISFDDLKKELRE